MFFWNLFVNVFLKCDLLILFMKTHKYIFFILSWMTLISERYSLFCEVYKKLKYYLHWNKYSN